MRIEERTTDDINHKDHRKIALRIMAALKHPDCPTFMLDLEASRLARFISLRMGKNRGPLGV